MAITKPTSTAYALAMSSGNKGVDNQGQEMEGQEREGQEGQEKGPLQTVCAGLGRVGVGQ